MFTFTILILPLAIAFYYFNSENKSNILFITIGVLTGALVTACKAFFSFSHRIIPYSFSDNFLFLLFKESLIPVVIIYAVFFLISKDSKDFKADAFFPLISSFYAVYLPYIIISSTVGKSIYPVFIKPLVFLSMFYTLAICVKFIFGENTSPLKIVISSLVALIYASVPAVLETIWLMNLGTILWVSCSAAYILLTFAVSVFLFSGKRNS